MKKLIELIQKHYEKLEGTKHPFYLFEGMEDSPIVQIELNEKNFNLYSIANRLFEILEKETKYRYIVSDVEYIKNGFGFANFSTFCHTSKVVGTTETLEELCKAHKKFFISVKETEKGRTTSWLCPLDLIDDKTIDILDIYTDRACIEGTADLILPMERNKYNQQQRELAQMAKMKICHRLGILSWEKKIINEFSSYGGRKEYKYIFDSEITEEIFTRFLAEIEHLPVDVSEPEYGYTQEIIKTRKAYDNPKAWYYLWVGPTCD